MSQKIDTKHSRAEGSLDAAEAKRLRIDQLQTEINALRVDFESVKATPKPTSGDTAASLLIAAEDCYAMYDRALEHLTDNSNKALRKEHPELEALYQETKVVYGIKRVETR